MNYFRHSNFKLCFNINNKINHESEFDKSSNTFVILH